MIDFVLKIVAIIILTHLFMLTIITWIDLLDNTDDEDCNGCDIGFCMDAPNPKCRKRRKNHESKDNKSTDNI